MYVVWFFEPPALAHDFPAGSMTDIIRNNLFERRESNFFFMLTREHSDGVQSCSAGASAVANILCIMIRSCGRIENLPDAQEP
jgi:hypothetical protein